MNKHYIFLFILLIALIPNLLWADGIIEVLTASYPGDFLPLSKTRTTVEINGQVAITTVENTFYNSSSLTLEAVYHFPVPVTASVTGMGRYVNGQLQLYTLNPGQQGGTGGGTQNPTLEEYLGENPFSIPISEIEPGELTLYFQFTGLLDYSFGDIMMTYPLWTPQNFIVEPTDSVIFDIDIVSQRIITAVFCNNYPGNTNITILDQYNAEAHFELYNVFPAEDFDLNYSVDQNDIGCWLLTNTEPDTLPDSEDGYFLLIIEPGALQASNIIQKYFTFILDKSGSMSGYPITQAKEAAQTCISLLDTTDFFNIIDFNYQVSQFSQEPVRATSENVADAIDYIDAIYASGSTNINEALLAGLNQEMGDSSANQIIFLTDGQPTAGVTNINQILANVVNANDDSACIFCFGIGSGVSNALLEGLALQNWGEVLYIEPGAPIGEEVVQFFMSIMYPVFINVQVDFGSINTRDVYPPDLLNIYYGSQTILFGRYTNTGITNISLSGTVSGADTTLVYTGFEFPEENPENEFVPRMWAISFIDYWLSWMEVNGEDPEIIDEIIFLSLKYGILTPYTQYVPVEELYVVDLNGIPQAGALMITWQMNRVVAGFTYDLYKSDNPSGPFLQINSSPVVENYFLDLDAKAGEIYYYKVKIHSINGEFWSSVFMVGELPDNFTLSQNYPNPFNEITVFAYSLPFESLVEIEIYNLIGQKLALITEGAKSPGIHHCTWKATNISSGQYFYRLTAKPANGEKVYSDVRRLTVVK